MSKRMTRKRAEIIAKVSFDKWLEKRLLHNYDARRWRIATAGMLVEAEGKPQYGERADLVRLVGDHYERRGLACAILVRRTRRGAAAYIVVPKEKERRT